MKDEAKRQSNAEQIALGGSKNQMAAERSKKENSGTFGRPNSLELVSRIGQKCQPHGAN